MGYRVAKWLIVAPILVSLLLGAWRLKVDNVTHRFRISTGSVMVLTSDNALLMEVVELGQT